MSIQGCNASDPYTTTGETPQEVESDIGAQSGADWTAIWTATYYLEAYMWKADTIAGITPPTAVTGNAEVQGIYADIVT